MFERSEDTGDTPGEFQLWVEREHLEQILPLPAVIISASEQRWRSRNGHWSRNSQSRGSVMALGLDPRFDLSKAYWIVAGIGGGDPADVSVGSAVWRITW